MATVGENAEKLMNAFPQLDLRKFIEENAGNNLEWAGAYILENIGNFGTLERIASAGHQNEDFEMEDTMELEIASPRRAQQIKMVDLSNTELLKALDRLADYFIKEKEKPRDPFVMAMPYMVVRRILLAEFAWVRTMIVDILLGKTNYDLQAIFTFLFFVSNNLSALAPFQRIANACKTEYFVSAKTFSKHLKPIIQRRKADVALLEAHDQFLPAIADFEKKLREIALPCTQSFGDLLWRDGYVADVIGKDDDTDAGAPTFECMVCFEAYPLKLGFHCYNPSSISDGPCSSNQIGNGDGDHVFCLECVRGQAQATLSGAMLEQSGRGIQCLAPDCKNPILFDHIRPYISKTLRIPLEKKLLNHNLNVADIKHLERCLKCDFAMDMEVPKELDKVFRCLSCKYEYCRFCQADWSKHFGISCDELREKCKEAAQHNLANKLSEAIIRFCPRCKLQFVKLDACNKMTCCNCRLTICYICRATNIEYTHFCNHFRDPKFPNAICAECKVKKCLLWEDYRKHDEAKIKGILDENKNPQPLAAMAN